MPQTRTNPNSVDDLLVLVEARGLRLANLFQFEVPGTGLWRWQANITDGQRFWEFGRGASAPEALRAALFISATTEPEVDTGPHQQPEGPGPRPLHEPEAKKPSDQWVNNLGF